MKLVWITPKWPFPVEDGARQATTTQLIKHDTLLGVEVHLCSIIPTDESLDYAQTLDELGIRSVMTALALLSSSQALMEVEEAGFVILNGIISMIVLLSAFLLLSAVELT